MSDVSADLTATAISQPSGSSAASGAHGVAETMSATIQSLIAADNGLSTLDALIQAAEALLATKTSTIVESGGGGGLGSTGGTYAARPAGVTGAVLYVGADNPTTSSAANSGAPALATDVWLPFGAGGTAVTPASIGAAPANQSGSAENPVTSPTAARPTGLTRVWWECPTQPTNLAVGDVWNNTTTVTAPTNTVAPAVTGTAAVGQVLTASTGTWTGTPTSYTYQWSRNGTAISGATSSSYTVGSADTGDTITVAVTATNATGSATATSAATATVTAAASTLGLVNTAGNWSGAYGNSAVSNSSSVEHGSTPSLVLTVGSTAQTSTSAYATATVTAGTAYTTPVPYIRSNAANREAQIEVSWQNSSSATVGTATYGGSSTLLTSGSFVAVTAAAATAPAGAVTAVVTIIVTSTDGSNLPAGELVEVSWS
jgi:hypothetical protein